MSVSELRKNEDQARLSSRIARSLSFSLAGLVYRQGINGIGYISFHWLMRRMRVSFYFLYFMACGWDSFMSTKSYFLLNGSLSYNNDLRIPWHGEISLYVLKRNMPFIHTA